MADQLDFITGLQGLAIAGVTMLAAEPDSAPDEESLPLGWVKLPSFEGGWPTTAANSAIRPKTYRAVIVILLTAAQQYQQKKHFYSLIAIGEAVESALDTAQIGFRLSYLGSEEIKVLAGTQTFYGVTALVSGQR